MKEREILLYNLPKVSLNEWYACKHWTKRQDLKITYKFAIKSQFKDVLTGCFDEISYVFYFKNNPLDASNCVAMLKLIEDIIFEKDGYKNIKKISIESKKASSDCVKIIAKYA